ncbi:MAG: hypothetical protein RR945_11620 [Erysipelotrichaceae bacterium]
MAIYDILNGIKDKREEQNGCMFNGYLEDYLDQIEDDESKKPFYDFFKMIFDVNDSIKICTDLKLSINKDAIANQIIRYKDSFKLAKGQIKAPYVLYGIFDDDQRAIILCPGHQEEYIIAKALYYVMSEPDNEFEGTRNEVISLNLDLEENDIAFKIVNRFFMNKEKAGIVQRSLDRVMFSTYDEMYELAQKIAENCLNDLKEILSKAENKDKAINEIIATWFLLKKFSYVQYMMDKNNLMKIHGGNVKKQRQVAKEKCDAIVFTSYSELWKVAKNI